MCDVASGAARLCLDMQCAVTHGGVKRGQSRQANVRHGAASGAVAPPFKRALSARSAPVSDPDRAPLPLSALRLPSPCAIEQYRRSNATMRRSLLLVLLALSATGAWALGADWGVFAGACRARHPSETPRMGTARVAKSAQRAWRPTASACAQLVCRSPPVPSPVPARLPAVAQQRLCVDACDALLLSA